MPVAENVARLHDIAEPILGLDQRQESPTIDDSDQFDRAHLERGLFLRNIDRPEGIAPAPGLVDDWRKRRTWLGHLGRYRDRRRLRDDGLRGHWLIHQRNRSRRNRGRWASATAYSEAADRYGAERATYRPHR